MKKYLLISHKYGKIKRGAYTSSEKLSEYYPDFLESKEDIDCKNLENLNKKYRKLIFVTQVPRKYVMSIDFIRLMTLNHIISENTYREDFIVYPVCFRDLIGEFPVYFN